MNIFEEILIDIYKYYRKNQNNIPKVNQKDL